MSADAPARTFTITPAPPGEGHVGQIVLPFDPRQAFGRARPPVVVAVNGHRFRSTIAIMGGVAFVLFRRSHRDAAGVADGEPFEVTLTLDTAPRTIDAPADLRAALAQADAWERWERLSFTHQREHVDAVEGAKKAETRARRIARCVKMVSG